MSDAAELSSSERALIDRARAQCEQEAVPEAVRERLLARALAEARRPEGHVVVPAALVPVRSRGALSALAATAALAAALVLIARGRGAHDGVDAPGASEAPASAARERHVGSRLFQSELFRAPASAYVGALPPPSASLLGELPFSPESRAWQARRWDDLAAPPAGSAAYEHRGGALCVLLGPGERVVAGWPWLPEAAAAPERRGRAPRPGEPPPVALKAGVQYRLVFKAWAEGALPEQALIAVGHAGVPFSGAGGARVELSTTPRAFLVTIAPRHDDPSVGVAFLANAAPASAPGRVCLSDVTLSLASSR